VFWVLCKGHGYSVVRRSTHDRRTRSVAILSDIFHKGRQDVYNHTPIPKKQQANHTTTVDGCFAGHISQEILRRIKLYTNQSFGARTPHFGVTRGCPLGQNNRSRTKEVSTCQSHSNTFKGVLRGKATKRRFFGYFFFAVEKNSNIPAGEAEGKEFEVVEIKHPRFGSRSIESCN